MQEILKHLSQQDEKNKESQQLLGQHLNNEAQKQNCLIEQLRQMVAEREAKVKELEEEIGQLALQGTIQELLLHHPLHTQKIYIFLGLSPRHQPVIRLEGLHLLAQCPRWAICL